MSHFICKTVPFASPEYAQTIQLRDEILRKPLGMQFSISDLAEEFNQIHIGGFIEDELVACLVMQIKNPKVAKMRQVAVRDDMQNMGLGTSLVHFFEEESRRRGIEQIELHAREQASSFYKTLAYQIVGEPFIEINIPHFLMVKQL